jgi:hypothetical protein
MVLLSMIHHEETLAAVALAVALTLAVVHVIRRPRGRVLQALLEYSRPVYSGPTSSDLSRVLQALL